MGNLFIVMAGGALGAGLRRLFGRAAGIAFGSAFRWGTPGVNLIGGPAIGVLAGRLARGSGDAATRRRPGGGVPGGFTTFSAFPLDTVMPIERGQAGIALGYVAASVAGAIGAPAIGLHPTRGAAA